MMGVMGEMYNVSGGPEWGCFYMLNMDTHGGTHVDTYTHTYTGALGKMLTNCQLPLLQLGTLRPREGPPHTLG